MVLSNGAPVKKMVALLIIIKLVKEFQPREWCLFAATGIITHALHAFAAGGLPGHIPSITTHSHCQAERLLLDSVHGSQLASRIGNCLGPRPLPHATAHKTRQSKTRQSTALAAAQSTDEVY